MLKGSPAVHRAEFVQDRVTNKHRDGDVKTTSKSKQGDCTCSLREMPRTGPRWMRFIRCCSNTRAEVSQQLWQQKAFALQLMPSSCFVYATAAHVTDGLNGLCWSGSLELRLQPVNAAV